MLSIVPGARSNWPCKSSQIKVAGRVSLTKVVLTLSKASSNKPIGGPRVYNLYISKSKYLVATTSTKYGKGRNISNVFNDIFRANLIL